MRGFDPLTDFKIKKMDTLGALHFVMGATYLGRKVGASNLELAASEDIIWLTYPEESDPEPFREVDQNRMYELGWSNVDTGSERCFCYTMPDHSEHLEPHQIVEEAEKRKINADVR